MKKRESIDAYIKRLKETRKSFAKSANCPMNFFHVLLECPHRKIPRFLVAEHICKVLNSIYEDGGKRWQVVSYKKNIVLAFGEAGLCPPLDFESNEFISYQHMHGYDCVSIAVEENTFYEAEYIAGKIFSDLKKAGF